MKNLWSCDRFGRPNAVAAQIPAGRLARPQELAAVAAFLASDPAGYVTGQAIACDGGLLQSI